MTFDGVILYGPPASGKDTVTAELRKLRDAYALFEKLKVGEGRTSGYRVVTEDRLADLRDRGMIVHEVTRYGASYAIDSIQLDELFKSGRVPIVHMGQVAGVDALQRYGRCWLEVSLWCSREVAAERLRLRPTADIDKRLAVWDATLAELGALPEPRFTLAIRTDSVTPAVVAATIHVVMTDGQGG